MKADRIGGNRKPKLTVAVASAVVIGTSVSVWAAVSAQDAESATPPSSSSQESRSSSNTNKSKVVINGETQPVPSNGSVHKTITDENGTTTVDIRTENSGTNSSNNQSLDVTVESNMTMP